MRKWIRHLLFVLGRMMTAYYLLRRYDSASYGVVVIDVSSHKLVSCNGCFEGVMGYSEALLRHWYLEDMVVGVDQEMMTEIFARVKNGGLVKEEDILMASSHGGRLVSWEFERMGDKIWGRCYFKGK